MTMRIVNALTNLVWRIASMGARVPPATEERIRLLSDARSDMEERDYWRKNYQKAYELLGILNEKAEALLVYGGITLAVIGVANSHLEAERATLLHGLITERCYSIVIAIVILASIFCNLIVVGIYWPFLSYAIPKPGREQFETEWQYLLKALAVRQACYQIAWLLAILALLLLVPFVLGFGL